MTALEKIISEIRKTTNVPIELKFEKVEFAHDIAYHIQSTNNNTCIKFSD